MNDFALTSSNGCMWIPTSLRVSFEWIVQKVTLSKLLNLNLREVSVVILFYQKQRLSPYCQTIVMNGDLIAAEILLKVCIIVLDFGVMRQSTQTGPRARREELKNDQFN